LKTYQGDLERWAVSIREEVQLLTTEKMHEDGHEIAKISTMVLKGLSFVSHQRSLQRKLRMLDLCSKYDFQTTWKQIRKTGNSSLFSECPDYQNWRGQSISSTLTYVGKLGSGKSVLLAHMVDDLSSWVNDRVVSNCLLFCRYDISESLKARIILGYLARQLLLSTSDLTSLKDLFPEDSLHLDIYSICQLLQRILRKIGWHTSS
jgi:hypothetical protein